MYDVSEETKEYNDDLMKYLDGVPRFSVSHGIDIKSQTRGGQAPHHVHPEKRDVTEYLFSDLEKQCHRDDGALTGPTLKVMGIPRHEPDWMKTIVEQSGDAGAQLGEGFIFVISKPVNSWNLSRERKRRALEDIKRLASDLGTKSGSPDIKVGRSPGRSDQELCDLGRNRLIHGFFWDLPEQYFLASVDGRLRRPRSGWGACSAAAKSRRKVFNL